MSGKMLLTVFLPIFCLTFSIRCDPQLRGVVLSCLKFHRPRLAVVFSCWPRQDKVKMHKMILAENLGVRLAFAETERDVPAKINTKTFDKLTYFLDMRCERAADFLKEAGVASKFGMFQFIYSWHVIVGNPEANISDVIESFKAIKNRMDMDVKIYHAFERHSFNIFEIYKPGINVGVQVRNIGVLLDGKIHMNTNTSYYERRKNMTGVLLRTGGVARHPYRTSFYEYMVDPRLKKFDIYSKFHFQLFLGLVETHGFSFNVTVSWAWFGNKSSGDDGGLAKMLVDDEIDITNVGGQLRAVGPERVKIYDYILPYYKFRSYFYFRNPGIVKPTFSEVFKPFAKRSWIVALYVTGIVCVCIEISYFVENRYHGPKDMIWFRSLFIVIAAFSQQGIDKVPRNLPGRIIFLHLLICSLLLYNYYTSSLVSSLISTEPTMLQTIQELLESNLKVGIELQPYTLTYLIGRVKHDHYLDLLNKTKIFETDVPNYFTAEEGIARVHAGGFAFHAESVTAYPLIADTFEQEYICDLAQILVMDTYSSLMAQKKSPYRKLFQVTLRKMWQAGLIKKLHKSWIAGKPECLSSARLMSVGINDLFFPHFLLAMGILFALIVLLLEILWSRQRDISSKIHTRNQVHC